MEVAKYFFMAFKARHVIFKFKKGVNMKILSVTNYQVQNQNNQK